MDVHVRRMQGGGGGGGIHREREREREMARKVILKIRMAFYLKKICKLSYKIEDFK